MNNSILNGHWVGLTRQSPQQKPITTQPTIIPIHSPPQSELRLAPLTSKDAKQVLQLMNPTICRGLAIDLIDTLAKAEDFIAGIGSDQKFRLAIIHHKHGFIGALGYRIYTTPPNKLTAMFSYWLGEQWQGNGYAYNALTLLFKKSTWTLHMAFIDRLIVLA